MPVRFCEKIDVNGSVSFLQPSSLKLLASQASSAVLSTEMHSVELMWRVVHLLTLGWSVNSVSENSDKPLQLRKHTDFLVVKLVLRTLRGGETLAARVFSD